MRVLKRLFKFFAFETSVRFGFKFPPQVSWLDDLSKFASHALGETDGLMKVRATAEHQADLPSSLVGHT